ncbi:MAG: methyltransferase [Gammaproteobacteria bacterium]|nr:methyltransferase [Gammaproteobacteria bacterium]
MKPIDDVSDLLQIAFGYMASKALFTAVSIGVFDVLDSSSKSLAEIQKTIGGEPEAVKTLIAALTAIGLIARKDEMFSNSPVAQLALTKSGGSQFSKYLSMQVDQQMYPMLQHLTDALKGNRDQVPYYDYEDWFRNTDEANTYSEAQHAVSQGVANALLQALDWTNVKSLLDVAGGTGAVTIDLLQQLPDLGSTIIDFPKVVALARKFASQAGVVGRIDYIEDNALRAEWPKNQDVVLMSYLCISVKGKDNPILFEKAYASLKPGGWILIHDFIADNNLEGPPLPILWALQHVPFNPGGVTLTEAYISQHLKSKGFMQIKITPIIERFTSPVRAQK